MRALTAEDIKHQQDHKDQDRTADIVAANVVMLAAAYVAIALRFISRRTSNAALQADDWMITVGLFFTSCFVAGVFVCVSLGLGKHSSLLVKPVPFAQAVLTTEVLYTPASTTIKFSILLLYRRIFPSKKLKIVLQCIAGFLVIFALAQMLSVIIQCTPVAALWNPAAYPDATCDNYTPALILFGAVNATTDIIILCLPMPLLWRLHVSKTRRKQLICMFSLGGLVCIVSICRCAYLKQVSLSDPSWDDVDTVLLSSVENCAGVISACLPTMLPVARVLRHGRPQSISKSDSVSTRRTGLRLSSLSKTLRTESDNCEPDKREGSFARLQHSSDEQFAGALAHSFDDLEASKPPHYQNAITVTTELEQTRAAASPKTASEKNGPSAWWP